MPKGRTCTLCDFPNSHLTLQGMKTFEHKLVLWQEIIFYLANLETGVSIWFWNRSQPSKQLNFSQLFVTYMHLHFSIYLLRLPPYYESFHAFVSNPWLYEPGWLSANVHLKCVCLSVHVKVKYLKPFQIHISLVFSVEHDLFCHPTQTMYLTMLVKQMMNKSWVWD